MENTMPTTELVRTGPKSKAPKEKTVPFAIYARIMDIEKVAGKTMSQGALAIVKTMMREHFAKLVNRK